MRPVYLRIKRQSDWPFVVLAAAMLVFMFIVGYWIQTTLDGKL